MSLSRLHLLGMNLTRSNLNKDDRKQVVTVPLSNGLAAAYEYTPSLWGLGFTFSLNYSLNAANIFNVYQTVLDYKSGKLDFEKAKNELTKNVKKSYFNMLLIKENIQVIEEQMEVAKERYENIRQNLKWGLLKNMILYQLASLMKI